MNFYMAEITIPGKWYFIAGEPEGDSLLEGMQKGTLQVTGESFNACQNNEPVLMIKLQDIKQVSKQVRRGYALAKIVGRYKQVYTFIPQVLKGPAMNAAVDQLVAQLKDVQNPSE
jgi:hypothetical protein